MKWIDFEKERPKENPPRQIWVRTKDRLTLFKQDVGAFVIVHEGVVLGDWAEIEPPKI